MCRWLAVLLLAGPALAQPNTVSVRIFSEPPGSGFVVDGERYTDSAVFLWPELSKHTLYAEPIYYHPNRGSAYAFKEWRDSADIKFQGGNSITITATRSVPFYRAVWKLFYSVTLEFNDWNWNPLFACLPGAQWGKVFVSIPAEDSCYATSATLWDEAGKTIRVQAHAPEGHVFRGWRTAFGNASSIAFVLDHPILLSAIFEPAARVRLETSPPGLQLLADRTVVSTPITLDWASGSDHAVGPVSPQRDFEGAPWVFESWTDGGAEHHLYTARTTTSISTLTARFAAGISFGFTTTPPGLQLTIDGRSNWPGYNFVWAAGSRHTVSAPAEQTDARGRRYVFQGWAHGGEATQEIVARAHGGWRAHYEQLGQLVVRTAPENTPVEVDGAACPSPCTIDRRAGTEVGLAAPAAVNPREGARMDFAGWSDGGSATTRTVRMTAEAELTARYSLSYRLRLAAEPPGSAALSAQPASADGFYPQDTAVLLVAEPKPGYRFLNWAGDLGGTLRSGTLKLNGPKLAQARLEWAPETAPPLVRNAAGETPAPGVAPGSLISIVGVELAAAAVSGPRSPLAQTLGGIAVRLGERVLPLLLVSPDLINAQLPSDLVEGEFEIQISREQRPELRARLQVLRNAPGLFADPDGFATAVHADGSAVTAERPAGPGESIAIFGTGFGPYQAAVPDGFAAAQPVPLADPVELFAAGQALPLQSATAAPGEVGLVTLRFRVPEGLAGAVVELRAKAGGNESNPVRLRVAQQF